MTDRREFATPEIVRYWRSEARPARLAAGIITANVVAVASYLAAGRAADPGYALVTWLFRMQAAIVLVYGVLRTLGSVSGERTARTWDFQRLTPVGAWELALGKLVGAPVFAFVLAVSLAPWALFAVTQTERVSFAQLAYWYGLLGCIGFGALCVGLFLSAYNDRGRGGAVPSGGVLISMLGFQYLGLVLTLPFADRRPEAHFYGWVYPADLFSALTAAAFGIWALLGATWRIGQDLQEAPHCWRFPAFLFFVFWYGLGIERVVKGQPNAPVVGPVALLWWVQALVYLAGFSTFVGADWLRRWRLSETRSERLHGTPLWLIGLAALILLAGLAAWLAAADGRTPAAQQRLLVMIPAFALRDLAFLQWCRLGRSRRPDLMAMVYLALVYTLPGIVLASLRADHLLPWVWPVPAAGLDALSNVAPSLIEAAVMAAALWTRMRQVVGPEPDSVSPSA